MIKMEKKEKEISHLNDCNSLNSSKKKILIIGGNGFLGRYLLKQFSKKKDSIKAIAADLTIDGLSKEYSPIKLDITNKEQVESVIKINKPDITILTAAMTNVDACEDKKDLAFAINGYGPGYVASAMNSINGYMIHISTDFVFDGKKGDYLETDKPNPISIYGKSKLEGERRIIESGVSGAICRTSVLFGWPMENQRDNFFSWAYKNLKDGKELKIIDGQITTPTLVNDLAECLYQLSLRYLNNPLIIVGSSQKLDKQINHNINININRNIDENKIELFHTTGPESISRYDFVRKIAEIFKLDKNLISKIDYFPQKAKRPDNSSLNTDKIQKLYPNIFRSLDDCFKFLKQKTI